MRFDDRYIARVTLDPSHDTGRYPFTLPAVRELARGEGIDFDERVTFLVGDNGTGKSTIIEAIAVASGFNAEGGSISFRFATRATESSLGDYIVIQRGLKRPRNGYFLRAESFYNVATEIERLGLATADAYGGVSLHERSHGESFLDLVMHRFKPGGLYILDEPEAALSVKGCLALVARIVELADERSQFIIATHSPVLLSVPGARILQFDDEGRIEQVAYDDAEPVTLTRRFLADPARYLRYVLED
ncbi:AAA family ATPase [Nocardioides sp.]|uniref:AAA family ATPase n=1 Tax=Nocardioides sp. TaxID=35761 RepID=UPI0019C3CAEA|nr:AAA family ATPase [Nocardioides sp.]MBC7275861.1 AAA family ATPase [Nocardioides sp.]